MCPHGSEKANNQLRLHRSHRNVVSSTSEHQAVRRLQHASQNGTLKRPNSQAPRPARSTFNDDARTRRRRTTKLRVHVAKTPTRRSGQAQRAAFTDIQEQHVASTRASPISNVRGQLPCENSQFSYTRPNFGRLNPCVCVCVGPLI